VAEVSARWVPRQPVSKRRDLTDDESAAMISIIEAACDADLGRLHDEVAYLDDVRQLMHSGTRRPTLAFNWFGPPLNTHCTTLEGPATVRISNMT
jgi:hypothetical protein